MQNLKSFLALVTLAASMSALAAQTAPAQNSFTPTTTTTTVSNPQTFPTYNPTTAPVGVPSGTGISDVPSSPSGPTNSGGTNWVNANSLPTSNYNPTSATTISSGNNPLLSTDPQFNVADVKVTASGGCEVKKNGAVIMTGGFAGSPCQKIYGKGLGQSTSSGALPVEYQPANLDISFDAQTLDARAY